MRQPFFSITNATIFMLLGIAFGTLGTTGSAIMVGQTEIPSQIAWIATGVAFLMAYFSLVHLKTDKRR